MTTPELAAAPNPAEIIPTMEQGDVASAEWQRLTGGLMRDIHNPEVGATLQRYCTEPVSETLPGDLLNHLPPTTFPGKLAERSTTLREYNQTSPVEDDKIVPDLWNAYRQGRITQEERDLVRRRYIMARDVKILALGAELTELQDASGSLPQPDENDAITLPSGIVLHGTEAAGTPAGLLDPTKWEGREQLKDRVYVVTVAGQKYVMKEQKTARHTDTTEKGHRAGDDVPAAHEFAVGNQLHTAENSTHDGVAVVWEQPLGYVTYPDGFQFGMYAFEEGLTDASVAALELEHNIIEHPEEFADEFAACNTDLARFAQTEVVRTAPDARPRSLGRVMLQRLLSFRSGRPAAEQLTYEEFAEVKAHQMMITAHLRQSEARLQAGLVDYDDDGTLYRVPQDKPELQIVGLDYERYKNLSDEEVDRWLQAIPAKMAERHQDRLEDRSGDVPDDWPARKRAALLSLLEQSDPRWAGNTSQPV